MVPVGSVARPFKGEHPEHPRSGETLAEYATFSAFGRDRVGAETVRGSLGNLGILNDFDVFFSSKENHGRDGFSSELWKVLVDFWIW